MVFFAIWWGWLNFTWFASAYDTDDWLYRVVTLVQMGGALAVAAGVPRRFDDGDYPVVVIGYVIMRLAMVFQWLRAARDDPPTAGATALPVHRRHHGGPGAVGGRGSLLPDDLGVASFVVLVARRDAGAGRAPNGAR